MDRVAFFQDLHLGIALAFLAAVGLHAALAVLTLRRYGHRSEPRLFAAANLLLVMFQVLQLAEFLDAAGRMHLPARVEPWVFGAQLGTNVLVLAMFFHLLATFEHRYQRPRMGLRSLLTHHLHRHARLYVPGVYVMVLLGLAVTLTGIDPVRSALADLRASIGPTSAYLFGAALWGLTFVLFPARPGQEHLAVPVAGRALLLTSLGAVLVMLAAWSGDRPRVTRELLLPLLHLHSVPVVVFLALVRYEFAFMDRYVNGVLRVLAWSTVVLGAYWAFYRVGFSDPDYGRLATSVARVGILLAAMAVAPWTAARVGALADRHLFGRRIRASHLRRLFARRMAAGQGLASLIEATCADIGHALRARGVHVVMGPSVEGSEAGRLRVPLRTGTEPVGWLVLGERRDLLPYFDGERKLLHELAPLLAGAIEALRQREPAAAVASPPSETLARGNGETPGALAGGPSLPVVDAAREAALQQRRLEEAQLPQRWTTSVLGAATHVLDGDHGTAAKILECLARVAHHVRPDTARQVRLVEEMEFARDLLALERVRRSNRLRTALHFPASLNEQAVPRGLMLRLLGRVLAEPVGTASAPIELEVSARSHEGRVIVEVHAPQGSGGGLRAHFPRRDLPARDAARN